MPPVALPLQRSPGETGHQWTIRASAAQSTRFSQVLRTLRKYRLQPAARSDCQISRTDGWNPVCPSPCIPAPMLREGGGRRSLRNNSFPAALLLIRPLFKTETGIPRRRRRSLCRLRIRSNLRPLNILLLPILYVFVLSWPLLFSRNGFLHPCSHALFLTPCILPKYSFHLKCIRTLVRSKYIPQPIYCQWYFIANSIIFDISIETCGMTSCCRRLVYDS